MSQQMLRQKIKNLGAIPTHDNLADLRKQLAALEQLQTAPASASDPEAVETEDITVNTETKVEITDDNVEKPDSE